MKNKGSSKLPLFPCSFTFFEDFLESLRSGITLMNNEYLPIIYQYLVGGIIFLIGILTTTSDKEWRKSRDFLPLLIILVAGLLYYFALHGFFQFFAPSLHLWAKQ